MWCLPDGDAGRGAMPEETRADAMAREERRCALFADFFVTCLKRLKGEFGESIRVGGPALCSWRARREDRLGTEDWFRAILGRCREAGVKPDFMSWHYYGNDPAAPVDAASKVRSLCAEYGIPGCELILDEWHYRDVPWNVLRSRKSADRERVWFGPASHNGIDSSCFNLAFLSMSQSSPLGQAYYYGCKHTGAWGCRDEASGEKYKVWHGLKMFGGFVRNFPVICASEGGKGLTVLAARTEDGHRKALLAVDYRSGADSISLRVDGVPPDSKCEISVHDFVCDMEKCEGRLENGVLRLPKRDSNSAAFLVALSCD